MLADDFIAALWPADLMRLATCPVPRSTVWPCRKAQIEMEVRETPIAQKTMYPWLPRVSSGSPGLPSSMFVKFMPNRPVRNWSGMMHTVTSVRM